MFVREIQKPNGSVSIRIVESVRRGNRVVQKMVRSLGQHKDRREIDCIKKAAEKLIIEIQNNRTPVLPGFDPADYFTPKTSPKKINALEKPDATRLGTDSLQVEAKTNDGIQDIFGSLYQQLAFDDLIVNTKQDNDWNQVLKSCVLARIAQPVSKKKTADLLEKRFDCKIPLDHLYRMMDHVFRAEDKIKEAVTRQSLLFFKQRVEMLLFDVTTLYFESTHQDELKDFGFSKDCKFNQTQVVLALMTTTDGTPMGYELFPGNTSEGKTLVYVIESVKKRFDLERVVLVADRAMFNKSNLEAMEALGVKYLVAAKLRSMNKKMKKNILHSKGYRLDPVLGEAHWLNEFETDEKRRLIVSYSSARARKDRADRERILAKLVKKEKDGKLKMSDLVGNQGSKKFVSYPNKTEVRIDFEKIQADEAWDGLHGVITNEEGESAKALLERYRDLWKIEEAFRFNKHDLKLRPVYHWKPERIRAHIAICYLAFALMSYARVKLKDSGIDISFAKLREELMEAESYLLRDTQAKTVVSIPSKATKLQKEIYRAFGLERKEGSTVLKYPSIEKM